MDAALYCEWLAHVTELGINPSHILQKSLAVLNPLARVDAHIMDDADLAGPIVFSFAFAFVLLLVRYKAQYPR